MSTAVELERDLTRPQRLALAAGALGVVPSELDGLSSVRCRAEVAAGAGELVDVSDSRLWGEVLRELDGVLERAVRAAGRQVTRCESCDQPVRWELTVNGKRIPLDPMPHPEGNLALATGWSRIEVEGVEQPTPRPAYRTHFATCPHAAEHRRPRPAAPSSAAPATGSRPDQQRPAPLSEQLPGPGRRRTWVSSEPAADRAVVVSESALRYEVRCPACRGGWLFRATDKADAARLAGAHEHSELAVVADRAAQAGDPAGQGVLLGLGGSR